MATLNIYKNMMGGAKNREILNLDMDDDQQQAF